MSLAMMHDEERFYRAQHAESMAAADATTLPKVKEKHLAAARSWKSLIDVFEARKGSVGMSDTSFEVPEAVADALKAGTPAVKAFRQSSGLSQHDTAADAGMTDERLAAIEQGAKPKDLELAVLSDVLDVPVDMLTDEQSAVRN